jgi:hypothetical protein
MRADDYRIVYETHPESLTDAVKTLLRDGWTLFGAPFIAIGEGKDTLFCQALITTHHGSDSETSATVKGFD